MSSYLVIGLFVLGLLIGRVLKKRQSIHRASERLVMVTVYALLFLLGIFVGINPAIMKNFPIIGFYAIFLSIGAILGSLILAFLVVRLFFVDKDKLPDQTP